jgi:tryptophan-rich sensory protein
MATVPSTRSGYGIPSLIVFVMFAAIAAVFGGNFHPDGWFAALPKPQWSPPNQLFAPLWTILYVMMAVAGWRVWRASGRMVTALHVWGAQLILNGLWPFMFFGLHRIDIALVDISVLLVLILGFIVTARRYSLLASWLFVPYAAWVGFATALNFAIWRLDPG